MAPGKLADIVIVVSGTHWQCVTCKLHQKRTASLDDHLKQQHQYLPPKPLPDCQTVAPTLSDGEEYEDVGKNVVGRSRTSRKTQNPVGQWLKKVECSDSSDDVDDFDDDDSDFVPSEVEDKPGTGLSRKTLRKQVKKDIVKRASVRLPRKAPGTVPERKAATEPELLSELEPPTEPEQTKPENGEGEGKTKSKSQAEEHSSGKKVIQSRGQRGKQKASEPTPKEASVPRKRGRPPKPKPIPVEGEELPPKRPYRKKIPDPSELLLKLRNVGRKPNTRKKLQAAEREGVKTQYAKLICKANPEAVGLPQVVTGDGDGSAVTTNHHEEQRNELGNSQDSVSSQDDRPLSQTGELSSKEKIRCKTCLLVFTSEGLLRQHLSRVSAEDVVQCLACEMQFHGLVDLNMHVFCDHEYEKQPACFLCQEDFKSMEQLEKHLYQKHRGESECQLADTRFHDCRLCHMELNVDFQLIKNHYYRRHKAYVCPECYGKDPELLFYTDTHLYSEHKQMHAKSPSECTICHMVFPTAREMKTHMWTHANDTTDDGTGGKCSKCDKWLPNSGAMLMHEKEHKNEAIRKNYALEASIGFPCMKCEHIFSSKSNLKKHSCKADPNRTFYFHCEYCAHGCNTKEQLRDHIALHHLGIKRYACDYCDQRFVCAPTLRRHVRRVHTKEKPYECHICKERFFERNLMLRHVSKHAGIASFMCEFCGKGFHTKFDLKKHVENHTDTRDFVCPNCGLDYKRSYHLKRHLEKGCWKKFVGNPGDESVPSVVSEAPLAAREDADEMAYVNLADDVNNDDVDEDDDDDEDMDNYNDESSGPDYVDDGDDDMN